MLSSHTCSNAIYFFCIFQVVLSAALPWAKLNVERAGNTRIIYNRESQASADTADALIQLVGAEALAERFRDNSSRNEIEFLFVNVGYFASGATASVPAATGKKAKKASSSLASLPTLSAFDALNSDQVFNQIQTLYEDYTAAHFVKNLTGFIELYCQRLYGQNVADHKLDSPYFDQIKAFKLSFSSGKVVIYSYLILNEAEDPDFINRMHFGSQLASLFPSSVPALLEQSAAGWQTIIETLKSSAGGSNVASLLSTSAQSSNTGKKGKKSKSTVTAPSPLPASQVVREEKTAELLDELEKEEQKKQAAKEMKLKRQEEMKRRQEEEREKVRVEKEIKAKRDAEEEERKRKLQSERDRMNRKQKLEEEKHKQDELNAKKLAAKLEQECLERKRAAEQESLERERAAEQELLERERAAEQERIAEEKRAVLEEQQKEKESRAKEAAEALKREQEEALKREQEEALKKQEEVAAMEQERIKQVQIQEVENARIVQLEKERELERQQYEADRARLRQMELENKLLNEKLQEALRGAQKPSSIQSSPNLSSGSSVASLVDSSPTNYKASPGFNAAASNSFAAPNTPPGFHAVPFNENPAFYDHSVYSGHLASAQSQQRAQQNHPSNHHIQRQFAQQPYVAQHPQYPQYHAYDIQQQQQQQQYHHMHRHQPQYPHHLPQQQHFGYPAAHIAAPLSVNTESIPFYSPPLSATSQNSRTSSQPRSMSFGDDYNSPALDLTGILGSSTNFNSSPLAQLNSVSTPLAIETSTPNNGPSRFGAIGSPRVQSSDGENDQN